MLPGYMFSGSIPNTNNMQLSKIPKYVACMDNNTEIELKVQQAISTLTEVLKDLQKRRNTSTELASPFNRSQIIDTSCVTERQQFYLPQHNLAPTSFQNGINTEGIAIVELVASEEILSMNKCDICDKLFDDRQKLRNHSRIHKLTRKYKCEICSLGFTVPSKLKEHMRTHTGERPYECKICLRCFTKSSSLKRHGSVHKNIVTPFPPMLVPSPPMVVPSLLQDQVVQSVDRMLSPVLNAEQMEPECVSDSFERACLVQTESELGYSSVSP